MATREKYFSLPLCNEKLGSWGNQGIEVACATWLSGGRVLVNHNTWYAHLFRTKGDFSFPYEQHYSEQLETKKRVWEQFVSGTWDKQIYPPSWLIEKFWPVGGWTIDALNRLKEVEGK
jgi:hypothetical protein